MEIKRQLGERIVRLYHGEKAAAQARADFDTQFSRKEVPENIEEYRWVDVEGASGNVREPTIVEHIVGSGLAASKSAARRLVEQGAVSIVPDGGAPDRVRDVSFRPPRSEWVLRVGRKLKRFKA